MTSKMSKREQKFKKKTFFKSAMCQSLERLNSRLDISVVNKTKASITQGFSKDCEKCGHWREHIPYCNLSAYFYFHSASCSSSQPTPLTLKGKRWRWGLWAPPRTVHFLWVANPQQWSRVKHWPRVVQGNPTSRRPPPPIALFIQLGKNHSELCVNNTKSLNKKAR